MQLLKELSKKHLEENYSSSIDSIEKFWVDNKCYYFNKQYENTVKIILKNELSKNFQFDKENFSIAGGSILTLLMYGSPFLIKDFDIFPFSEADYKSLEAKLDKKAATDKIAVSENENSKSYRFPIQIDLIKKFYPSTLDCIRAFDLSICQFGFDSKFNFYKCVPFQDIFNFRTRMSNEVKPEGAFAVLRRIVKYAQKGFKINDGALIDLFSVIKSNEAKYKIDYDPTKVLFGEDNEIYNDKFIEVKRETEKEANREYHTLKVTEGDSIDLSIAEIIPF